MTTAEILMLILTAGLVMAGAIAVIVANGQWGAMRGQLRVMERQLEEMKATGKQTDDLVVANKITAEAAKASVAIAQQTLIVANRAWVSLPSIGLGRPLEAGFPIYMQVRVENLGKAPAIGLKWRIERTLIDYIDPKMPSDPTLKIKTACDGLEPDVATGTVIWPSTDTKFWIPYELHETPEHKAMIESVLARQKSLVISVCVMYFTFGETHKTWAQFFLRDKTGQPSSTWMFNLSPGGNGAD